MIKYNLILFLECVFIFGLIVSLIPLVISIFSSGFDNFQNYLTEHITAISVFCVSAIGFIARIHNMYVFTPKIQYQKHIDEQINYWIKNNPEYTELKNKLKQNLDLRKDI